jgi:hypothetical protein
MSRSDYGVHAHEVSATGNNAIVSYWRTRRGGGLPRDTHLPALQQQYVKRVEIAGELARCELLS